MSQILSNKDLQSKSIYTDPCQNSEEIEKIYKSSKKVKNEINQDKNNIDYSHIKLYSKDSINEKDDIEILDIKKEVSEYKSCYEEKIKEDDYNNINNNMNIDMEIKILEKIKNVDLSTINSNNNSNNNNFIEEKSDLELNKMFEINFDNISNNSKESECIKFHKKEKIRNNNTKKRNSKSLNDNNYRYDDLNSNNSKNNYSSPNNNRTFSSFSGNNKYFFVSNNINNKKNNCFNNIKSEKDFFINKIKFEGINKDEINKDYFHSKLKTIPIKSKNINNPKNRHIKTLFELQDFMADESAINVMKIDNEGKYLAVGFKSGKIKIYEIMNYLYEKFRLFYDKNNLKEYLYFINETPIKSLLHSNEIIDLFWLLSSYNYLLSSSLNLVILWQFHPENDSINIINTYRYSSMISCLCVNTIIQNMFATGCSDKFVKIWTINKSFLMNSQIKSIKNNIENQNDEIKEFYVEDEIISINFLQEGDKIIIGTNKGKILIYRIIPNINFEFKFDCKNRFGKPITNINFFSSSLCIISSLDSRIRFVNIKDGKIIHKYKGHKNDKSNIKTNVDLCNDIIITGSENGKCYLWNIFNKENNKVKNYSYEYFNPFLSNDVINVSQIISEKCYVNYYQKILKITNKIILNSIIICANDKGRIKIMLNLDESY